MTPEQSKNHLRVQAAELAVREAARNLAQATHTVYDGAANAPTDPHTRLAKAQAENRLLEWKEKELEAAQKNLSAALAGMRYEAAMATLDFTTARRAV